MNRRGVGRVFSRGLVGALLIGSLILVSFPFYYLFSTAFKRTIDAQAYPPVWVFQPTLDNFARLLKGPFPGMLWNDLVVTVLTLAVSLVLGLPAAYALSRSALRGRRLIGAWLVASRLAPPAVYIIPMWLMFRSVGLLNTHVGLSLSYLTFTLPFVIWIMTGYFADIPSELEDAARIDGCSRWQAFRLVALPLAAPGIASVAILTAISAWGEYFFPLILGGPASVTAPVGIVSLVGEYSRDWGAMAAGGLLIVGPVLILAIVAQRWLLRGLTVGALKG